ncbi:MAG: hypothetical protein KBD64_01760 [Gammaproteobacteria bacterium]|nr:hypothetical protein [Gammaproteobacteria bacterium]
MKNKFTNYFTDAFSIDLRALGALRIGLGLTLIFFLYNLCQDITMFFTDEGLVSRNELIRLYSSWPLNWRHTIYLLSNEKFYFIVLFFIQFISAFLFTIGYKTRLNCFISWFLLLSLQNRNYFIMSGFDLYLRLLIFWGFFLPLNARYSFDLYLSSDKLHDSNNNHCDANNKPNSNNSFFSIATFAILLQVSLLYLFSSLLKHSDDKWWVTHTALNYIIHNELYLTPIGYIIHHWFSNYALQFATLTVLIIELITPIILFFPVKKYRTPLRVFWFILLTLLHVSFRLFLYIGPFLLISLVGIIIILPSPAWDAIENTLRNIYQKYCSACSVKFQYFLNKLTKFLTHSDSVNQKKFKLLKLTLLEKLFIFISISFVIHINIVTYYKQYKHKAPVVHEFAEVFGLDQYWGFFDRPATISHMLRFYGIQEDGTERQLWITTGYGYNGKIINLNMREYLSAIENNWWWKYLISYSIPDKNYKYFRETGLIRALCTRENKNTDLPPIKKLKILYNWYPQVFDQTSLEHTSNGKWQGWYYIQFCP